MGLAGVRIGRAACGSGEDRGDIVRRGGRISRFARRGRVVLVELGRAGRLGWSHRSGGCDRQLRNIFRGTRVGAMSSKQARTSGEDSQTSGDPMAVLI
jgi:hypothetical protein